MTSGTKALCVDDRFPPEIVAFYDQLPVKNRIYTIRDIGIGVSVSGQPGKSLYTWTNSAIHSLMFRHTQSVVLHNSDSERLSRNKRPKSWSKPSMLIFKICLFLLGGFAVVSVTFWGGVLLVYLVVWIVESISKMFR